METLTKIEIGTFLKLFNRGGYVLDFSTNDFDIFTMDSIGVKPIEQAKISCAKKLFNEMSTRNVKYHDVDSYQNLLNVMKSL